TMEETAGGATDAITTPEPADRPPITPLDRSGHISEFDRTEGRLIRINACILHVVLGESAPERDDPSGWMSSSGILVHGILRQAAWPRTESNRGESSRIARGEHLWWVGRACYERRSRPALRFVRPPGW